MESVIEVGISLGFSFRAFPKFQDACSTLRWCSKALSYAAASPTLEDVEMFLEVGRLLPVTYSSCVLYKSLIEGTTWLKKSLEIAHHCDPRQFKLSDVEEILRLSQKNIVSFPQMVNRLQKCIEKHKRWLEKVNHFFTINLRDRSWASLLQLRNLGNTDAFSSYELDMVLSEVEKVEQWKQCCQDIVCPMGKRDLICSLLELKSCLDRSFYMYEELNFCQARKSCSICHNNDLMDQKLLTCSLCKYSFHLQCIESSLAIAADSTSSICPYCNFIIEGKILRSGFGLLRVHQSYPPLSKLTELLSDAEDLCLWIEERMILHQIVEKALKCQAFLAELADFVLAYLDKDLSVVAGKLSVALKAADLAGVCYSLGDCRLDLALARNSWKVRAQKLLEGLEKPTIQQIQRHLKEGLAISISSEDYFRRSLTEARNIGMQWADTAKRVSVDGGAIGLDKVFELITEGENLPVHFEKELKLLRERSMLYCICRRPYDQRPMVACDKCDEWYHFDCVNLSSAPEMYICPACDLEIENYPCSSTQTFQERCTLCKSVEPQTPPPRSAEYVRKPSKHKCNKQQKIMVTMDVDALRRSGGIEDLLWRNRKPFKRVVRKRVELGSLSPFLYVRNS